ncbi:MAG TPA: alpha/beta hydrolase [Vicinamibacterales bacterium]|nr:alpha/beta hydrolase [Vicinamibacterales bacterium]
MRAARRPPGRLVEIGGFRLHVNTVGEGGPVVVFDAALAGSSISWTFVQPAVSRFARALTYDRAGFGWSDAGPMPRTAGRIADELHRLLERTGEPPPYLLVGHSFGGLVMQIFAARFAAETAALVLVDPAHPQDWVRPAPKEQVRIDRGARLCRQGGTAASWGIAHLVSALVGAGALGSARALVKLASRGDLNADADQEWLLAPMFKLPPDAQRTLRWFWTQRRFYDALGSQIEWMPVSAAETLAARAGGYGDLPLVTISSTNPSDHRLRQQEALAAMSTRGRHLMATHSGHWIPLDQPELVVAVIQELHAAVRGRKVDSTRQAACAASSSSSTAFPAPRD